MPVFTVNSRSETGGPVLGEGEQILYTQQGVSLYFDPEISEGDGTLYVTNKHATWLSNTDPNKGFSIDFPFISLHAISRDKTYFPHECLYCQLDVEAEEDQRADEEDEDDEENGTSGSTANGTTQYTEARFVASDPAQLQPIFDAFSQGASLNPDIMDDEEGDFFFNEDEVNRNIEHLDNALQMPTPQEFDQQIEPNQFDDAADENMES